MEFTVREVAQSTFHHSPHIGNAVGEQRVEKLLAVPLIEFDDPVPCDEVCRHLASDVKAYHLRLPGHAGEDVKDLRAEPAALDNPQRAYAQALMLDLSGAGGVAP